MGHVGDPENAFCLVLQPFRNEASEKLLLAETLKMSRRAGSGFLVLAALAYLTCGPQLHRTSAEGQEGERCGPLRRIQVGEP